ncbi:hypothetical protein [Leptospira noguchii]|uniref:Uncharacterized protein n=1 Tax=Leptospira noguchii TaxID=28182 RepID=A0AAE9GE33_9LEPT|nr:hypothetical protein [Leptospira noguchii]UOG55601.1 hypothetical protein MAL03_11895 [Leptospira noguchii]
METKAQRSLRIALWDGAQFYRGFVVIPTDLNIEIQMFVGLVMGRYRSIFS